MLWRRSGHACIVHGRFGFGTPSYPSTVRQNYLPLRVVTTYQKYLIPNWQTLVAVEGREGGQWSNRTLASDTGKGELKKGKLKLSVKKKQEPPKDNKKGETAGKKGEEGKKGDAPKKENGEKKITEKVKVTKIGEGGQVVVSDSVAVQVVQGKPDSSCVKLRFISKKSKTGDCSANLKANVTLVGSPCSTSEKKPEPKKAEPKKEEVKKQLVGVTKFDDERFGKQKELVSISREPFKKKEGEPPKKEAEAPKKEGEKKAAAAPTCKNGITEVDVTHIRIKSKLPLVNIEIEGGGKKKGCPPKGKEGGEGAAKDGAKEAKKADDKPKEKDKGSAGFPTILISSLDQLQKDLGPERIAIGALFAFFFLTYYLLMRDRGGSSHSDCYDMRPPGLPPPPPPAYGWSQPYGHYPQRPCSYPAEVEINVGHSAPLLTPKPPIREEPCPWESVHPGPDF